MKPFFKYWWETDDAEPFAVFGIERIIRGRVEIFDTSALALELQGTPMPPHPSFEEWVAAGRPVFERPGKVRK